MGRKKRSKRKIKFVAIAIILIIVGLLIFRENQRIIIWFSAFFVYNNREIILKMGLLLLNCDHLRLFLPKMFQQLKHSAETFLGQAEFSVHLLIAVLGVV